MAAQLRASNIYVIDKAENPVIPSTPKKKLIFSLAILLGLMGGLGLALFLEHLDDTLRTSGEAERYLSLPTLGLVPTFPANNHRLLSRAPLIGRLVSHKYTNGNGKSHLAFYPHEPAEKPVMSIDSLGIVNEAYRTLRTGILLAQEGQPPKTVLFTSAVHGEGKTATVVNSAISFARMGARVLLIDADAPSFCHKILGMRRGLGVASCSATASGWHGRLRELTSIIFFHQQRFQRARSCGIHSSDEDASNP